MREQVSAQRCRDAVGVLPLEAVLAQEHDRIHGDDVSARIRLPLTFTADQIIAPSAFAHRMLRAWTPLRDGGARESRAIDAALLQADAPPLDAVGTFVLGTIGDDLRPAIYRALEACANARSIDTLASDIPRADAALIVAILPHFDRLLDKPLEREEAFTSFILAGAVDALGDNDDTVERRMRRLLLEGAFEGQIRRLRDLRLDEVYRAVRRHDTAALCLSGGGIRSATFAIGLIRGLAQNGVLGKFDYLSTVSGGGYAGSWLSAWMHHTSARDVQDDLSHSKREKLDPEPAPMQHLRAYSHYLAPRIGALSTDTWTLIATIGRNLLFNWMVLLPLMAAVLLVPRYLVSILRVDYDELPEFIQTYARTILIALLVVGISLGIAAARFVHAQRPDADADSEDESAARRRRHARSATQSRFMWRCFIPLTSAALILPTALYLWWTWGSEHGELANLISLTGVPERNKAVLTDPLARVAPMLDTIKAHPLLIAAFVSFGVAMHLVGWLLSGRVRRHPREVLSITVSGVIAGLAALLMSVWFLTQPDTLEREMRYATLAPPAFLAVMLVGSQLFTALTSFTTADDEREWVTRFNAWLLIAIVVWTAACGLVLYGPPAMSEGWQQLSVVGIGGAAGVIAVLLAQGANNARPGATPGIIVAARRLVLALAAPVFILCIVVALATSNERLIGAACSVPVTTNMFDCRPRRTLPDDYSHSRPFVVLARHLIVRLDTLATQLGPTGTERRLLAAIAGSDAEARQLRASASGQSWDGIVIRAVRHTSEATKASLESDEELRQRVAAFTAATLATDSMTVRGIGGDSVLKALFVQRMVAEQHADSVLRARRGEREALAVVMDEHFDSLENAIQRASVGKVDTMRAALLDSMHGLFESRLRSSIATFSLIRADSALRAASHDSVAATVRRAGHSVPYDGAVPATVGLLFVLLMAVGLGLGSRVDTNKFSLRAMYEMRLVRAYLGASRPDCDRQPNPFTGFDPHDDLPIGRLWPASGVPSEPGGRSPGSPPMHVVNVTLNLVDGGNLAWQQRKAESMTITPLHAGSAFVGYRPTTLSTVPSGTGDAKPRLYGGREGVTLGTAVTISGAAASPNAGSHSSPTITFLMTFFNARLGAWLGNPGRAGAKTFDLSAPSQRIQPILAEMFGLTTDRSPYVYLSDGGHFENLALYEMVMRRCRLIVVSDAGCDPTATFDDLGNAVRKIRVDLGVPIEFPGGVHIHARDFAGTDPASSHWAVGRIRYSAVDHTAGSDTDPSTIDGLLIYIKPAIYGREPADVRQYARTSATFPHESTSDQFFSESQFESYRALGEFIARECVAAQSSSPLPDIRGNRPDSLLSQWAGLADAGAKVPSLDVASPYTSTVERR